MKNLEFRAHEIFEAPSFTEEDAEALIEYIKEAKSNGLATKKDVFELKQNMSELELKLTKEIRQIEVKIEQNHNSTIRCIIGIILGQTGLIFSLLKLFDKI